MKICVHISAFLEACIYSVPLKSAYSLRILLARKFYAYSSRFFNQFIKSDLCLLDDSSSSS